MVRWTMRTSTVLRARRLYAAQTMKTIGLHERASVVAWLDAQADVAEDDGHYTAAAALSNAAAALRNTMEVLEERRNPPWSKDVICTGQQGQRKKPGCGSSLWIVAGDLSQVTDYDRPNGGCRVAVFKCPLEPCGVESDLPMADVPGWIFDTLKAGTQRGQPNYGSGRD